jgi:hypothetical protein
MLEMWALAQVVQAVAFARNEEWIGRLAMLVLRRSELVDGPLVEWRTAGLDSRERPRIEPQKVVSC